MNDQELQDFYKSDTWKNATHEQKMAFQSRLRAKKRVEKEQAKKVAKKKAKQAAQPATPPKLTKRQKYRAKLAERRRNGLMPVKAKDRAPTMIEGVDVTSVEFLSTYEWRKTRMIALKKYGARCQCCGASAATGAVIHVDHIKPRKLFPQLALDVDNLQVLCHECNHGKGNWDMTDWRGDEKLDAESAAHIKAIQQE